MDIPQFNLKALEERQSGEIKRLEEVLEQSGVWSVHGVDQTKVDRAYAEMKQFSSLAIRYLYTRMQNVPGTFCYVDERGNPQRELLEYGPDEGQRLAKDFPTLHHATEQLHGEMYRAAQAIADCLGLFIGSAYTSILKYTVHNPRLSDFMLREHVDDHYSMVTAPIGEPLEVHLGDSWVPTRPEQGAVTIVRPGIPHRVSSHDTNERYSALFVWSEEALG